jgi:NAD(P)-dependent dehydrogenase (short-subunit alcohol dehydrogenase family)
MSVVKKKRREKTMDLGLKGKVALVTGAGSQKGMGRAIAVALAREGCDVIVGDIDLAGAEKTAAEIKSLGSQALAVKADLGSSAQVNDMVKAALKKFGKIDILVNNAGGITPPKPFVEKTEAEWDADLNTNFRSVLNCTKAVLGQMISRKSGKIVNIATGISARGLPYSALYGAAKAGVIGFTKGLAAEVAALGINVNSIAPGMTLTNFGGGNPPPDMLQNALAAIPLKRTTLPQDIANAVVFLVSDMSVDIVGQLITVNGGETMIG